MNLIHNLLRRLYFQGGVSIDELRELANVGEAYLFQILTSE